jgi:hypothetical protein
MKKENLTVEEKAKLNAFYAECVSENVIFPSLVPGTNGLTIQELVHRRNIKTLDNYADFLDKQKSNISRTEKREGASEKTISGSKITFSRAVEMVDLIIKNIEYENLLNDQAYLIEKFQKELDNLKTPEERRKELIEKLNLLKGVTSEV